MANLNFSHVCDFRFVLNFTLATFGIPNFIGIIIDAIKRAKNKAQEIVGQIVQQVVDAVRAVFDTIVEALTFDPTGEYSFYITVAKDILDKIEELAKKIAEVIERILVVVFVAKQIIELIRFIMSLPDRIKALVAQCIANFLGSVKRIVNQIVSIPDQVIGQYNRIVSELTGQIEGATNLLEDQLNFGVPSDTFGGSVGYLQTNVQTEKELTSNLTMKLTDASSSNTEKALNKVIVTTYAANNYTDLKDSSNSNLLIINTIISQTISNSQSTFANTSNSQTVTIPSTYDKANTANTLP